MSELAGVVVAAGRGSRMGGDKLWTDLWGRPVWRWSLDALLAIPGLARVALVVPPGEVERFRALLPPASDRCLLVEGGETRSASVEAGLVALADAGGTVGRNRAMDLGHAEGGHGYPYRRAIRYS